ncbi:MAG TPA: tocopherol cyclase family protein, partial [Mobilitalea sp.]|nr:tocopherol cyclase family protein [Mobilitalea sp.]
SFYIKVGENEFTRDRIKLNIETEGLSIHGELSFKHIIELPKTLLRPGIMGPFSYLTFMECYHGVVNIHHDIEGCLNISGRNIDFTGGYGYIEKDWGRSFPENWVWLQSNHFGEDDVTVMFSKAKIPFLGSSFEGFLSLLRIKDRVLVFATYTGAKLRKVEIDDHILRIRINNIRFQLELLVLLSEGGRIIAPKNGRMNREIIESINAVVKVRLSSRGGRILYEGQGTNTGLEIVVE